MLVEIIRSMTSMGWIILAVIMLAYVLLLLDISRNGNVKSQSFFTWLLWGILDTILFITTLRARGEDLPIIAGCVIGSFTVSIFLFFKKKRSWNRTHQNALYLTIATVIIWLWSGDNVVGIIFAVVSELIAGIPQLEDSWRNPGSKLTLISYTFFTVSYVLSVMDSSTLEMKNVFFPIAFFFYNLLDSTPIIIRIFNSPIK